METIILELIPHGYTCMFNVKEITLSNIYQFFIDENDFTEEELNQCKFICNGFMNFDTVYDDRFINVITTDSDIKQKFMDCMILTSSHSINSSETSSDSESYSNTSSISTTNNYIDGDMFTSDEEEEQIEIVDNTIQVSYNQTPVEYLNDPDFKTLINIIKNKPEYLQLACMFLKQGDVEEQISEYEWDDKYNDIYDKLNTEFNNDNLKNIICHFDGNENLIRRYLFKY